MRYFKESLQHIDPPHDHYYRIWKTEDDGRVFYWHRVGQEWWQWGLPLKVSKITEISKEEAFMEIL